MLHKYLKKLNHWVSELQKLRWALINVRLGPDTRWNKIHNTEFQSRRFETSKHDKHGSNALPLVFRNSHCVEIACWSREGLFP